MGKPKSSYALWILGHLLRFLFALLIITVCTLIVWRVAFSQRTPKALREIADNDVLSAAYAANGGNLTVLEQPELVKYTQGEDNYAYFNLKWSYYIPEAKQLQVLVFYNKSTLERLAKDRALEAVPPRDSEVFSLVLTQYLDMTPAGVTVENEADREKKVIEIKPTSCQLETYSLYTFCRYTFDNVELSDNTMHIWLDFCYGEGTREQTSYGTLVMYDAAEQTATRALSSKEKKIIEK